MSNAIAKRSSADFDRLPPQNLDAEKGVLGGVLLDNAAYGAVSDILRADDFWRDSHQVVWGVLAALLEAGRPVDPIVLGEELDRLGKFDAIGGDDTIAGFYRDLNHSANTRYYAEIVRQKSESRAILLAANDTLREAYSNDFTSEELLERFQRRALSLGQRSTGSEPILMYDAALAAHEAFLDAASGGLPPGLPTGFAELDEKIGGLRGGHLVVIGARPAMGKTAAALNIAEFVAETVGAGVLFISQEMNHIELAHRLLSSRAEVNGSTFLRPTRATDRDRAAIAEAVELTSGLPIWIDASPSLSAGQVAAVARRHKIKHPGLGLIIVDYLQLLQAEGNGRDNRQEQVADISRRLKSMARELDIPVLALCQLSRNVEGREDKRPKLSDLRETGQIEQDAHHVMFLHRPEYYDPNDRPGMAEVIISKNRSGETGIVNLAFEKRFTRFSDLDQPVIDPNHPF